MKDSKQNKILKNFPEAIYITEDITSEEGIYYSDDNTLHSDTPFKDRKQVMYVRSDLLYGSMKELLTNFAKTINLLID